MSAAMGSRAAVLERIRAAGSNDDASTSYAVLSRDYCVRGQLADAERVALMIERLREYDAEVVECRPEELPETIAAQIAKSGRKTIGAPPGLPVEWRSAGCMWRVDDGLAHDEIERLDGVVTGATCGVAESGTIVLHHTAREGRRVLSLLPDWHLCVLFTSQIVETLPEYFAECAAAPALVTLISGPSATADIEMTRIKGVHGPRYLNVIVVHDK